MRKVLLGVLLIAGLAFATWFCFLENPLMEDNTASLIGVRHPALFLVYTALNGVSFCLGALAMYRAYGSRNLPGRISALFAPAMLLVILFTQGELVDGEIAFAPITKTIHWTATVIYVLSVVASLSLLFFLKRKQVRGFAALCVIATAIVPGMIFTILTIGKSGLFEAIPIWMVYILLFLVNCTKIFPMKETANESL